MHGQGKTTSLFLHCVGDLLDHVRSGILGDFLKDLILFLQPGSSSAPLDSLLQTCSVLPTCLMHISSGEKSLACERQRARHCPLPTYRRGSERFSRLFALQSWLRGWCACNGLGYVDNWSSFWEQPALYRRDGLHPSPLGSVVLSRNIERAIR
ncbi:hypothetical protein SRHO_G00220680 [Serrasalmus rhombeus]